ncbi:MAG: single-stranded-DNA-specific exonuclease RecJ [Acidobacteriia bacterium]|nr:single-stranded-DNA-specific exonuclease RecJ [Terriglobia bacterium]
MRWHVRSADPAVVDQLSSQAGIPPLIARLLALRGVNTVVDAQRFLAPRLEHLHSPYLMHGMRAAVERIRAALAGKETILIYGDYDVDGTTAIVILKTAIELLGGACEFHVPHRIREGYGMKDDVIERAASAGVRLIISVDTGIRAFAAAETARRVGVDLIVTDHHLPETNEGVPETFAVLNPNQPGCEYPCKALCGAGVAFKVVQALLEGTEFERLLPSFLKMVAIATIADAVPLTGENRVIARLGLEGLRDPRNAGLKALIEVAALDVSRRVKAGDIAFRLAPRINAAGRMDIAQDVIDLFCCNDAARARDIALKLNQLNSDRQQEEQRIVEEACARIDGDAALREAFCIVVEGAGWHRGVIGIVATRVVVRYHRPALVVSVEGEDAYGSGRSISAFHLLEALESCGELFTRFGGHAHAVGFALPAKRVAQLRSGLDTFARTRLTPADFVPSLELDGELSLDQVTPDLYQSLCALEPYGIENPEPVFLTRGLRLVQPPRVLKEKHIKLRLAQNAAGAPPKPGFGLGGFRAIDALGWRMAERLQQENFLVGDLVDAAFTVDMNDHPDFGGLQLSIEDVQKVAVTTATR